MPTQIEKTKTFAVNFISFVAMYQALKNTEQYTAEQREAIEKSVYTAIINHPNPAEA